MSAVREPRPAACCSVTSTAMPTRCGSSSASATTSARARIQTQWPSAWRMRNSRSKVPSPAWIRPFGERDQIGVVGMGQRGDLADGEQSVLRFEPEDLEHRARPEDRAAREVPFPKARAAAAERRVNARLRRRIDEVGLVRARRLRVIGEAEDDEHDARRDEDGRLARDGAPPFGEDAGGRLHARRWRRRRRDCGARWRSRRRHDASVSGSTPARSPSVVSGWPGPRMSSM